MAGDEKTSYTDWEKIFIKDISNKRLFSKLCKKLLKLNNQKTNKVIEKWAKDLNKYPKNENVQLANRHMKRCFTAYVIMGIQTRTM